MNTIPAIKYPDQITKAPIPTIWHYWRREVDGIKRFLDEYKRLPEGAADNRTRGHVRYYRKRLRDLKKHEPQP